MNRRTLLSFVLAAAVCLFIATGALAGVWEDEMRITDDAWTQYRSYIATAPDDTLYVAWPDWTDWEDTKINLMKSTDRGHTWTGPWIVAEGLAYDNMELCADENGVHLLLVEFYEDEEYEYKLLYYANSQDGGETFTDPIRVGDRQNIEMLRFFSGGGTLFIYAQNYDHENEIAYNYLYASDDGVAWQENEILPGMTVQNPGFTFHDGVVHMAYGGFLVTPDIMYAYTDDAGFHWSVPVAVSQGAGTHSQLPQVAVEDQAIHVAWEDDRAEHFNIMYSRSTDGGATWSSDVQLNDTWYGARVKLLADEEGLHAVWCQYHGDDGWPGTWSSADYGIIWYKFSDDSGVSWADEFRVSQNEDIPPIDLPDMGANYVKLAEYGTGFCAMWQDKRDGNIDLYLRNSLLQECPADFDDDGDVDTADLLYLLAAWGTPDGDVDGDGDTDTADLLALLAAWGPCS